MGESGKLEVKDLRKAIEEETGHGVEFPLHLLPKPALENVLKYLTKEEKNNLRRCSKRYNELVFQLCRDQRTWYFSIDTGNLKEQAALLAALKIKQTQQPRYLDICLSFKLDIDMKIQKKLLFDWRDNLAKLEIYIEGNEDFLTDMIFPKLHSLELKCRPSNMLQAQMEEVQSVIVNHASSLRKLNLSCEYKMNANIVHIFPKLSLTTLIVKRLQMGDVYNLLEASRATLKVLDMEECLDSDHQHVKKNEGKLENLQHLRLSSSSKAFEQVKDQIIPSKLVTLSLLGIQDWKFMDGLTFPNLKFLLVDSVSVYPKLAKFGLQSLEVLVVFDGREEDAMEEFDGDVLEFPKLRELIVEESGSWSIQVIKQNASTLQCLTILRSRNGSEVPQEWDCKFPKMRELAGASLESVVTTLQSKCPPTTVIQTDERKIVFDLKRREYPVHGFAEDVRNLLYRLLLSGLLYLTNF